MFKKLLVCVSIFCGFYASPASAACTVTSGAYSISGIVSGCYNWEGGGITIAAGSVITSNSSHVFNTTTNTALTSLINYGSITAGPDYGIFYNPSGSTIAEISNYGSMSNSRNSASIFIYKSILTTLNNSGTITQTSANNNNGAIEVAGSVWGGQGTITTLNNTGTISSVDGAGVMVVANGLISSLNNSGTISVSGKYGDWGKGSAIVISPYLSSGTITTITNTGTLSSTVSGGFGIWNNATLGTLNNYQGATGSHGSALTYSGRLPQNYNIILGASSAGYGQLSVTSADYTDGTSGKMTFGIADGNVKAATYTSVISGVADEYISAIRTGVYKGYSWVLQEASAGAGVWDLLFSGSALTDVQASLASLADSVRSMFSAQTAITNFANMNTYDCDIFDRSGVCISLGGQVSSINSADQTLNAAVAVAGYQISQTFRVGGFLNMGRQYEADASLISASDNPLFGAFAVWNDKADHTGLQVKLATAFQFNDLFMSRGQIGLSESGKGRSHLSTESYVGEISYAFLMNEGATLLRPYLAMRYTRIKLDGYIEFSDAETPLSFGALNDQSLSALAGLKVEHRLTDDVSLTGSLGLEYDLDHHVDQLTASGLDGLIGEDLYTTYKKTRAMGSVGAQFRPSKNKIISADVSYQQLPYQDTGAVTAYVRLTVGF